RWHLPETFRAPATRAMMEKIHLEHWDKAERFFYEQIKDGNRIRRARGALAQVQIQARGTRYERTEKYALGDPYSPESTLSDDRLIEKFRTFTDGILPVERQKRAIDLVFDLDKLADLRELVANLTV